MRNSNPNQSLAQRLADRVRPRRVPVLLQMTTTECGAACLAMVLSYFGRRTRVSECSDSLGASRDGLSAHTLAQGARKYGLRVKAYSLEPAALEHLALPAIAHWAFNHFVVVERWSPKRVDIIDPGCGRRRLSPEEFDKEFTGVVLAFEPEEKFEPRQAASRPALLNYFQKMLRIPGASALLGQVLGVSALLQVLGLVMPLFTKVMVDKVLPLHLNTILPIVGLGMVITVLAEVIGSYLRSTLLIRLEVRLDSKVMLGFFEHVLALPFRFFQQRTTGDLLMRLGSNTIIRETLSSQTVSLILDGAFVVVYLVLLMALAPIYCATVLVIGLLYVGVLLASRRRTQELVARDLAASSESQSSLVEALSG